MVCIQAGLTGATLDVGVVVSVQAGWTRATVEREPSRVQARLRDREPSRVQAHRLGPWSADIGEWNAARLGARGGHAGANAARSRSPSRRDFPAARAVSRAPRRGDEEWRAKCPAPWRAKRRVEWLPEWRSGAYAKGARKRMRRPRRGSSAGPVARASVGGGKLGPWSTRGGGASKARRAREAPRGTARKGHSDERREWRRERARRAARMGARVGANPNGLPVPAPRPFRAAPAGSRGARGWAVEGRAERYLFAVPRLMDPRLRRGTANTYLIPCPCGD